MTDAHYAHPRRADQNQGLHYSHFRPRRARKYLNRRHPGDRLPPNPGANPRSRANSGELAQACVCFANAAGGTLLIDIEDDAKAPPADQRVEPGLLDRIRRRVGELTVNVQVVSELKRHENGGEYVALTIPRATGIASTSDGRYFLRVGDTCRPIVGDDVMRLANERPATPWEEMTSLRIPRASADTEKVASLCAGLRASDRVKPSVKEKTDDELLTHYGLAKGDVLTNLGVLLVGDRQATSYPTACCARSCRPTTSSSSVSCSSTRSSTARTRSLATST